MKCSECKTERATHKGMYHHMINAHGFNMAKAYDETSKIFPVTKL